MSLAQPSNFNPENCSPSNPAPNLASNNPFRNRTISSSPHNQGPPQSPYFGPRPTSRNPFLDVFEADSFETTQSPVTKHLGDLASVQVKPSSSHNSPVSLLNALSISDTPAKHTKPHLKEFGAAAKDTDPTSRWHSGPSRVSQVETPNIFGHRSTRSKDDNSRLPSRALVKPPRQLRKPDISADPFTAPLNHQRRGPRRNSDSSILEERRFDVLRSKDHHYRRETRIRDGKPRDERPAREGRTGELPNPKKANRRLDVIDKLDVTSIYGTGLFHHDGPFDACNPHRNRKGSTRAPMQAFPKDSANNALGCAPPLNPKNVDHSQFMGTKNAEAFTDYAASGTDSGAYAPYNDRSLRPHREAASAFNAAARVDPVHGDESLGLGTSTFLEGAPASKKAIQRRQSETAEPDLRPSSGLQRKKSLAQKLRGMSQNRPGPSGRVIIPLSPEPRHDSSNPFIATSPLQSNFSHPQSAGARAVLNERNPFFNEFGHAYDQKGEKIAEAEKEKIGGAKAPSNSIRGSVGILTSEDTPSAVTASIGVEDNKPSGFLSRVRSLKGRRPKQVE
ncbi:MAG: hypothetical protein M1829_001848 [Trizodia sp. TS-e1964]|nr:MAG: hypothetical protein M1829_001848 [Trizodia sp. TS-e1964]